tara:strand:+ start:116 stop:736 length:621 start_codon:yes stop_codon:yes gene_type:complete
MAKSGYLVPDADAMIEMRILNSRFIGLVSRVESAEEARGYVQSVRKRFPDASHYVFAFAAGFGNTIIHGMSDDGEPSGTAGKPVLSVVKGSDLGDIVTVVVRYFGGIKLGTGGLVRAYTATAKAVLEKVTSIRKIHRVSAVITVDYAQYDICKKTVAEHEGVLNRVEFNNQVSLYVALPWECVDEIVTTLGDFTSGRACVSVDGYQ